MAARSVGLAVARSSVIHPSKSVPLLSAHTTLTESPWNVKIRDTRGRHCTIHRVARGGRVTRSTRKRGSSWKEEKIAFPRRTGFPRPSSPPPPLSIPFPVLLCSRRGQLLLSSSTTSHFFLSLSLETTSHWREILFSFNNSGNERTKRDGLKLSFLEYLFPYSRARSNDCGISMNINEWGEGRGGEGTDSTSFRRGIV